MNRLDALKQVAFEEKGFDGFAVFNWANLLYLAGVPGAVALVIPRGGESTVYAYGVNYEQAKAEGKKRQS
jgi:Xaa-Pro aminopeptidase